jgi:hypothetical protein
MAITQPASRSKSDEFASSASDAQPRRLMRGRKQLISLTLPPELLEEVDAMAAAEDRSRAWMITDLVRAGMAVRRDEGTPSRRRAA